MRKTVPVVATASVVALVLAACSSGADAGSEGDDGPVTLDYWAWGTAQQPMVDAWNAAHPDIQVKHTDAGGGTDSSAKLVTATRAENAPDVAIVEYNTLPAMIVAGVAAEITDHVDGLDSEFAPGVWSQVTFDGATYGVPQDAGPQALTYNKARLDELGIDVPTTWAEFADAAEKVHEADPDTYLTTFAPAEFGGFAGYAQQAGAQWWTVDGDAWTVDFDDAPSVAVADYWQDLVDRDLVLAEPMLTPEWNAKVNKGEVLSWPAGLWAAGVLYGIAEDSAGDWAMAPLPQWTAGESVTGSWGGSSTAVTNDSKHKEAAAAFAKWLNTDSAALAALVKESGIYPAATAAQ
ncbi:MAG: ABC transporter substrate-binding protein, partial [Pseudonocardia sp.]